MERTSTCILQHCGTDSLPIPWTGTVTPVWASDIVTLPSGPEEQEGVEACPAYDDQDTMSDRYPALDPMLFFPSLDDGYDLPLLPSSVYADTRAALGAHRGNLTVTHLQAWNLDGSPPIDIERMTGPVEELWTAEESPERQAFASAERLCYSDQPASSAYVDELLGTSPFQDESEDELELMAASLLPRAERRCYSDQPASSSYVPQDLYELLGSTSQFPESEDEMEMMVESLLYGGGDDEVLPMLWVDDIRGEVPAPVSRAKPPRKRDCGHLAGAGRGSRGKKKKKMHLI